MRNYLILLIGLVSLSLFSCVNEEGEGGVSVIQGKVFKVLHPNDIYKFTTDTFTVNTDSFKIENYFIKTDTFPAAKEDVYIVYGDEPIYGDKMETGIDGFFRFKYLTKGTYTVYAYSTTPEGKKVAVIDTLTIGSGETKNVQDIYLHEGKSLETSYIKGTVHVTNYNKGSMVAFAIDKPACDVRVFIRDKGASYHFDEVKTGIDGVFMFQGLASGRYEVFVLTENPTTELLTPVSQSVTIERSGIIKTFNHTFNITASI